MSTLSLSRTGAIPRSSVEEKLLAYEKKAKVESFNFSFCVAFVCTALIWVIRKKKKKKLGIPFLAGKVKRSIPVLAGKVKSSVKRNH
eukprot:scaffold74702_cov53-Attheya_sp.AAC.1